MAGALGLAVVIAMRADLAPEAPCSCGDEHFLTVPYPTATWPGRQGVRMCVACGSTTHGRCGYFSRP